MSTTSGSTSDVIVYPDGSLTKIRLENFLAFKELELNPGPNLNLIAGPNGTGKSAVICGICLALGGTPKLLGRSERLCDYVHFGCQSGSVEIHIRDTKRPHDRKVQVIIMENNHAEYRIDGKKVPQAEVKQLAACYSLQVDNPCVFLAQDKVKSFAEQTPELLLENTEKASSSILLTMHNELKALSKQGGEQTSQKKSVEKRLKVIEGELRAIQPRVESYLRKRTMQRRLSLLQKKEAFLVCEENERWVAQLKEAMKENDKKMRKINRKLEKDEMELQLKNQQMVGLRRDHSIKSVECRTLRHQLNRITMVDSINEIVKQKKMKYKDVKNDLVSWQKQMAKAKSAVDGYEAKLADQSAQLSLQKEKEVTKKEYDKCLKKEDELDQQTDRINTGFSQLLREKESITEADSRKRKQFNEKLQLLETSNREAHYAEAFAWYEAHKGRFKKPVYVPLLSMTLNSDDAGSYLESVISVRDLTIFIFGCSEDERLLANSRHPWKISSSIISDEEVAKLLMEKPILERMKVLGFERTAFHLFSAPPAVKAYLNSVAHLSDIPIGTEYTKKRFNEVCNVLKNTHRMFLAPGLKARLTKSRYRDEVSILAKTLCRAPRYLTAHMPSCTESEDETSVRQRIELIEQKSQKLRAELDEAKRALQEAAVQKEGLRKKLMKIYQELKVRESYNQLLASAKFEVQLLENKKPDVKAAAEAVRKAKHDAIHKTVADYNRMHDLMERLWTETVRKFLCECAYERMKVAVATIDDRVNQLKEALDGVEKEITERRSELERATEKANESKCKLMDVARIGSALEEGLNHEQKNILDAMKKEWASNSIPCDLEAVRDEIADEEIRIDVTPDEGSKNDLDRQNALLAERDKLNAKLQSMMEKVENWRRKMDDMLGKWLTPLEELLTKINERYIHFFRLMGCFGEVHLQKPENKFDIEHYGVMILVKFREGESLRQLTHQTQSGGERSVATMLYLMALQELCPVPFRCVDEINQGMDANNERRVFEILVSLLCGSGSLSKAQYFMLTPKLLLNLQYGDRTKVHIIGNCDANPETAELL